MTVALIWAEARNGVIGHDGTIPWRLPEDLAHFRATTDGGTVVMGRRTWDSLPPRFRPLPGRRNVVITRQGDWSAEGAEAAHSLEEALEEALEDAPKDPAPGTTWVIGGGEIYRLALPFATRVELTEVDLEIDGDTLAPELPAADGWQREPMDGGWLESSTGIRYRFITVTRDAPA